MLRIAEQFRRRNGEWPSLDEAVWELQQIGLRWGGGNLFTADFDATESLFRGEILESCRIN